MQVWNAEYCCRNCRILTSFPMGPEIQDIHTVKEKLSISSAKRNYDYLLDVLAALAELV